jgi:hypothetical protein
MTTSFLAETGRISTGAYTGRARLVGALPAGREAVVTGTLVDRSHGVLIPASSRPR